MIQPDQIPDEVYEAASRIEDKNDIGAVILAAINAWPGAAVCHYMIQNTESWELVLPLPQSKEEGN